MKYENLLGEIIDTDEVKKKQRQTNPMVTVYGLGPPGERCKNCTHLHWRTYSKKYYKCSFRGDTHSPKTDHRVNWPACLKFKPIDNETTP